VPRYMVERTFPNGLNIPINEDGIEAVERVVAANGTEGVTWVHSYVSSDKQKTYCVYDGPSPDAIQAAATNNGLPFDSIVEVRVLDPYFYR
jgi:Nickel responsive protein SCO4226-like